MSLNWFINCGRYSTRPCATIDFLCGCDSWPLKDCETMAVEIARNDYGRFQLSLYADDLPVGFSACCCDVRITIDWFEAGVIGFLAYEGSITNVIQVDRDTGQQQINGRSIIDKLNAVTIAYKTGSEGALKCCDDATAVPCITAIEAAYQYAYENLVEPLPDRGDGQECALDLPPCFQVIPPTASQIAASPPYCGNNAYKNLMSQLSRMGKLYGFDLSLTAVDGSDDCCTIYQLEFVDSDTSTDGFLLSECLENVAIDEIRQSCLVPNRIHVLGDGTGVDQLVVTVCSDDYDDIDPNCIRETTVNASGDDDETLPMEQRIAILEQYGREQLEELNIGEQVAVSAIFTCDFIPFGGNASGKTYLWIGDTVQLERDDGIRPFIVDKVIMGFSCTGDSIEISDVIPILEELV